LCGGYQAEFIPPDGGTTARLGPPCDTVSNYQGTQKPSSVQSSSSLVV